MKMIENVWKYVRVLSSLQTLTVRSFRFRRQPVSGQFPACESKGPITGTNLTYPAITGMDPGQKALRITGKSCALRTAISWSSIGWALICPCYALNLANQNTHDDFP